ncbi:aromatic ring-hydroxylating oxygenase subunit alpha [Thauera linaloolentis]|uniref:Rieske (2Fe-2S) domain-containing protein n=1 Tax=Thauera linaloolentis (strain DSM 12138 / JCM 21573 / CCUG 41526 / CIP 105981 / IAM 15112 / NBRC 102519 / 47Lol) TaxID=1123367 RepID=N6XUY7_THAL4|nr:aromatic ring-hydroxylating dioxygenase subunit alpha [Thauera linaloolentis]ENO85561.1 Rieske (2Fe-2S) domain-containing protein [Thauera linaloolentis 47Lol = DSM 12138]MCM8566543.1 aromatic ring-hydroxylating dioxygenase subunit alpha [Thauera linaloolentis]
MNTPCEAIQPGAARCPGPSTADIIRADGDHAPAHLTTPNYRFIGDEDIDFARYTTREFFEQEKQKLWLKVWQWACREEDIPEAGDYFVYEITDRSVIIVRTADGTIKAYPNSCLHRGTQLKPAGSAGRSKNLRCPFHGFTWSLEGALTEVPCRWDFPHIDDERFRLPALRVETWGGFVFINFDDQAPPLAEHLGILPEHFANWDLSAKFTARHVRKLLPANWKACLEAFLESYHVLETHPQGVATVGDANSQYDIYGDTVSRFVHLVGYPSPHLEQHFSEQQILDALMAEGVVEGVGEGIGGDADPAAGRLRVPEGGTARQTFARHLQGMLGTAYGKDFSHLSVTETIDAIEYALFPNTCLFPSLLFPMVYRFRPNGNDPDTCIFDLLFLQPLPDSGERPDPAEPFELDIEQSFHEVPGFDPGLATIYDQDTGNLIGQQRGFKSSTKHGETLGNYQEVRIRQLHRTLDAFLRR